MDLRTIEYELVDNFELLAREIYGEGIIPLHRPLFEGREVAMSAGLYQSNFVSSVGKQVNAFEDAIANFTGSFLSSYCEWNFCSSCSIAGRWGAT